MKYLVHIISVIFVVIIIQQGLNFISALTGENGSELLEYGAPGVIKNKPRMVYPAMDDMMLLEHPDFRVLFLPGHDHIALKREKSCFYDLSFLNLLYLDRPPPDSIA